ncbi:ABC transporter permease [Georgenia satyanarayanai]|uniref:ABC transporter permease n=1 Tax=Georgenia satyanarayanai TaxID=860221 RepID=UPI001264428F|nr:ABC transporter permease [Georgenia satyanarayanai]
MAATRTSPWARLARGNTHTLGLLVLAVAVAVLFSALNPSVYTSPLNIESITLSIPEIGLMALAISIAMTTAGIDLSIVSVANLSALTAAYVSVNGMEAGMSTPTLTVLAVVLALVVGMVCGAINAVVVAVVGVAPILATLATQMIFAGAAIALTRGEPIYGLTPELTEVGSTTVAAVPLIFWLFLVVVVLVALVMTRTGYGLRATMLGASATAADYTGIARRRVLFQTYILAGTISAVAGLVMVMRTVSASAGYGSSYLLLAVTIAVLGGANPFGGRVAIWGTALAAVILQMLSSGFNMLGLSSYVYQIAQGLILAGVWIVRMEGARASTLINRKRNGRRDAEPAALTDLPYEEGHHEGSSRAVAGSGQVH